LVAKDVQLIAHLDCARTLVVVHEGHIVINLGCSFTYFLVPYGPYVFLRRVVVRCAADRDTPLTAPVPSGTYLFVFRKGITANIGLQRHHESLMDAKLLIHANI
jgi:hypothetical protein